jgi:hypothetical protein
MAKISKKFQNLPDFQITQTKYLPGKQVLSISGTQKESHGDIQRTLLYLEKSDNSYNSELPFAVHSSTTDQQVIITQPQIFSSSERATLFLLSKNDSNLTQMNFYDSLTLIVQNGHELSLQTDKIEFYGIDSALTPVSFDLGQFSILTYPSPKTKTWMIVVGASLGLVLLVVLLVWLLNRKKEEDMDEEDGEQTYTKLKVSLESKGDDMEG